MGWLVSWLVACLVGWLIVAHLLACSLARSLTCLFALVAYFDLLGLVDLRSSPGWTPETQPNDALRRRLVEFLVFNVLALVWLELARLMISLVCLLVLLCFGLVGLVACLASVCFGVPGLLALLCYATICDGWIVKFHLARLGLSPLGLSPLGLAWLGRLGRWHALDFEQKNPWNLSKRAPTRARFEVEHDF